MIQATIKSLFSQSAIEVKSKSSTQTRTFDKPNDPDSSTLHSTADLYLTRIKNKALGIQSY